MGARGRDPNLRVNTWISFAGLSSNRSTTAYIPFSYTLRTNGRTMLQSVHLTRMLFTKWFGLCLQTQRPRLSRALAAAGRWRPLQHEYDDVCSGGRERKWQWGRAAARVQGALQVPGECECAGADAGRGQRRELRRMLVWGCRRRCDLRRALDESAARALLWYA